MSNGSTLLRPGLRPATTAPAGCTLGGPTARSRGAVRRSSAARSTLTVDLLVETLPRLRRDHRPSHPHPAGARRGRRPTGRETGYDRGSSRRLRLERRLAKTRPDRSGRRLGPGAPRARTLMRAGSIGLARSVQMRVQRSPAHAAPTLGRRRRSSPSSSIGGFVVAKLDLQYDILELHARHRRRRSRPTSTASSNTSTKRSSTRDGTVAMIAPAAAGRRPGRRPRCGAQAVRRPDHAGRHRS